MPHVCFLGDMLQRNLQYYPTCTEMGHSCTEMGHSGRSAVSPHFVSPSKRCNGICAAVDFCGSRLILQVPLKHVPRLFDGAISNFGALNCVEDLAGVARALGALVRPGGYVAICTMGRFCVWETLYYGLRLDFKRALRRLAGRAGEIRYPTVRQLHADFAADFELVSWSGVGKLVPPSYVKLSARIVNVLACLDRAPVLRACAD